MSTTEPGPLPCWLGFTGHRELSAAEAARLEGVLTGRFKALRQRFPHTRVTVLSALAEGADRAAARAALAAGCSLVCPLPMPRERYLGTFADPGASDEFDALAARADRVLELPGDGSDADAYAALGRWLCRHSHLLIAALDLDDPGDSPGGTGWVLQGRRGGRAAPREEQGPELVVPVSRVSGDATRKPAAASELPADLLDILGDFDDFNRRARANGYGADGVDQDADAMFDAANAQAERSKQAHLADLVTVLVMGFVAFGSYEAYNAFLSQSPGGRWVLLLFPLLLGAAWVYVRQARKRRTQDLHLEMRVLAESVRVHRAWQASGVQPDVYTVMSQTRLLLAPWLVEALRPAMSPGAPATIDDVVASWVQDQADWFSSRTASHAARVEQLGAVITASLMLAGLGLLGLFWAHTELLRPPDTGAGLALFTTLCLAAAAAVGALREKLLVDELSRRYQQHKGLFESAARRLAATLGAAGTQRSPEAEQAARETLRWLGTEALAEHVQWMHLHSSRPLEPPA